MDKLIELIYICTGTYKNYAYEFFKSLKNFFPMYRKTVKVLTDDVSAISSLLENIENEYEHESLSYIDVFKITDLPYPLINLGKFSFINDYIDDNATYIFYFDADTILIEKDEQFWHNLENVLDKGKIIIPPNVYYLLSFHPECYSEDQVNGRIYDMEMFTMRCAESENSVLADKLRISDPAFVWAATSIIAGTAERMRVFIQKAIKRLQETMINEGERGIPQYAIPRLFDESIANKMIYESYTGEDMEIEYYIKPYSAVEDRIITPDFTFAIQKYKGTEDKKHS